MTTPTAVPSPRRFPRLSWTILLLTSLAVALYFPLQYTRGSLASLVPRDVGLASTYANRPLAVQVAFYAHITFAGLALLVGPFQFSSRIRHRHVRVHHAVGRVYITACLLGGAAAFVMSFFSSVGLLGFFGFGSLAVIWVLVTLTAYRAIRRRDTASHQAWMMRSFALTYAAPTLRLWLFALLIPQLLVGVPFAAAYSNAYAPVPFLAWIPNLVVVELMIRRRGLPALRLTASPTAPAAGVRDPAARDRGPRWSASASRPR
ncbi:MAG TPA: DUF2306 domain-containing protein [Friedmanniella sp.]